MRGPGMKLNFDTRRTWACPTCGSQRRLPGEITSVWCNCREGSVLMTLASDAPIPLRAERLTPRPVTKRSLPEDWFLPEPVPVVVETPKVETPPPVSSPAMSTPTETPVEEVSSTTISMEETVVETSETDDFGADLELPPDAPTPG